MNILLSGAAGFVGSHLAERLVAAGHYVIGIDNLITGSVANVSTFRDDALFDFVITDVCRLPPLVPPLDWVMHFASPASPPKYTRYPLETLRANSEGTRNLLELARRHQAAFFLASTSEVYGDPLEHPQREDYWGNVNPIGPRSVYDESKRFSESITMAYHTSFGLPVRIIRIFNTYGPRMDADDGRVVTNFIRQALAGEDLTIYGDGRQTRSLQYVDDLIDGITRFMKVDATGPLNLGNPHEMTVRSIADMVIRLTGSASGITRRPLPDDDPKRRRPDIGAACRLLDWQPRIPPEEGLARTIAWFRELRAGGRRGTRVSAA